MLPQTDEHPMGNLRINLTLVRRDKLHDAHSIKKGNEMRFAPEGRLHLW